MSQVGPIGVTPRPRPVLLEARTGTDFPCTIVLPEMLEVKASVCATECSKKGASRHATTTRRNTASENIATRSRRNVPSAVRQGPGEASTDGAADGPASDGTETSVVTAGSLHPELVDEHVELLAELVVADPLRGEVDQLRRDQRCHGSLLHHRLVNLAPQRVRLVHAGPLGLQGLLHLAVDLLVAETSNVDARVAAGVEGRTGEQHVEEVRGCRVVLVPRGQADLHLVLRVLDVGELDVRRDGLQRSLEPDRVQHTLHV